jgi:hypothetical protein
MRIPTFTFKNEAIWMVVLSVAPIALALLVILILRILR